MQDWTETAIATHNQVKSLLIRLHFRRFLRILAGRLLFYVSVKKPNPQDGVVIGVSDHLTVLDYVSHDQDIFAQTNSTLVVNDFLLIARVNERFAVTIYNVVTRVFKLVGQNAETLKIESLLYVMALEKTQTVLD